MKRKSIVSTIVLAVFLSLFAGLGQVNAAGKSILGVVSIVKAPDILGVGEWGDFNVAIDDWSVPGIDYIDFTPVSSNPKVLKVEPMENRFSVIHGVSAGTATLTVDIGMGYDPYEITVEVTDDDSYQPSSYSTDTWLGEDEDDSSYENELMMDDLYTYVEQFTAFQSYETKANSVYVKYRTVTASNRKAAFNAYNNVILPNYAKVVNGANKISPPNEELKEVHKNYKASMQLCYDAYKLFKESVSTTKINMNKFNAGVKKMNEARKYAQKAESLVDAYMDKYSE